MDGFKGGIPVLLEAKVARLLQERCQEAVAALQRDHRSFSLERSVATRGDAIHALVEFVVHTGLLPMADALAAVRQGLGEALHAHPDAFYWATEEFQGKMRRAIQESFGQDPWRPYNEEIVQYDDPRDRARAWCEAQGRLLVIADATRDRLKETGHSRHSRIREGHLKRLIAAAKEQIQFAAELGLIPPDDAMTAVLQGVDHAFRRGEELQLIADKGGDQRRRLRAMIASELGHVS